MALLVEAIILRVGEGRGFTDEIKCDSRCGIWTKVTTLFSRQILQYPLMVVVAEDSKQRHERARVSVPKNQ
jgi:hypothetical protein